MTRPRSELIVLEKTKYYHCIARCVRRSYLCGTDNYSGKNFDHRKYWIVKRLKLLEEVFAIDIAAYAIMPNHYHLVLHVDSKAALQWTSRQVIQHWLRLYKGEPIAQRYIDRDLLSESEMQALNRLVEIWRTRLSNISWFMSCLNRYIAYRANLEDDCTGHFWEGRFKSQALLDEAALISCMTYVDLNPVRAKLATNLETSHFTSIQGRIISARQGSIRSRPRLLPFADTTSEVKDTTTIPYSFNAYLALVYWTGCCIRGDKPGFIKPENGSVLKSLNLSPVQWLLLCTDTKVQSITMLDGLDTLSRLETKLRKSRKGSSLSTDRLSGMQ